MMKRSEASMPESGPDPASRTELYQAAYRAAEREMALLQPGEAMLYHEGHLAIDVAGDPATAGRAAAFRDAAENERGIIAQRRIGLDRYQYIFWRARHERR
jgi:hypothetical protein